MALGVLGQYDRNLRLITKAFPQARITARGDRVRIQGEEEDVERLRLLFEKLAEVARRNHTPSLEEVRYLIGQVKEGRELEGVLTDIVQITHWGEAIRPRPRASAATSRPSGRTTWSSPSARRGRERRTWQWPVPSMP